MFLLALFGDSQVIGYRENSRNCVRPDIRDVFVGFVIHHAYQRYVPVIHDDVNGRLRAHRIAVQACKAINRTVLRSPDAVSPSARAEARGYC